MIVAGLQSEQVTAGSSEGIKAVEQIQRTRKRRRGASLRCRPVGRSCCVAEMSPDINAGPIVRPGRRRRRRLGRQYARQIVGVGAARKHEQTQTGQALRPHRIPRPDNVPLVPCLIAVVSATSSVTTVPTIASAYTEIDRLTGDGGGTWINDAAAGHRLGLFGYHRTQQREQDLTEKSNALAALSRSDAGRCPNTVGVGDGSASI